MTKSDEVVDGECGTDRVVGGDRVDARVVGSGGDDHGGGDMGSLLECIVVESGTDEDERLDLELQMGVDGSPFATGISPAVEDQHREAVFVGCSLDAGDDFGEEGIVDVVDDDAECLCALLSQAASVQVGEVTKRRGRFQHGGALGVGHLRRVVHHQTHQGPRDAGPLGNGLHCRSAHVLSPSAHNRMAGFA